MTTDKEEVTKHQLLPCSFKFYDFNFEAGQVRFSCHIIKMEASLYLWAGDFPTGSMNDLTFALLSQYETLPISTRLMGSLADTTSTNFAKRLAKKIGKPVYVSFNIGTDNLSLPAVEKRIFQEFKEHPEILSFD
ncbi:proteasome assembly chaperone 4 [Cephus cinctus]|uniref:Proteasome assembly chaperone 4 n=1 Tax=Cephus cinctus TaxID=211228 RepID=A0AAJ7RQZ2_CEPCN|nr:proteasome assembly chaperone 4 [Cephus cinctus]